MRQPSPTVYTRADGPSHAPVRAEKVSGSWRVSCSFLGHRWFWNQFRNLWELVDEDKLGPAHQMTHRYALSVLKHKHCHSKKDVTPLDEFRCHRDFLRDLLWLYRGVLPSADRMIALWRRDLLTDPQVPKGQSLSDLFTKEAKEIVEALTSTIYRLDPIESKPEVLAYELPHPETGLVLQAASCNGRWVIYCDIPGEGTACWNPRTGWGIEVVTFDRNEVLEVLRNAHSPWERYMEIPGEGWSRSRQKLKSRVKQDLNRHLTISLQEMGFDPEDTLEIVFRKKSPGVKISPAQT